MKKHNLLIAFALFLFSAAFAQSPKSAGSAPGKLVPSPALVVAADTDTSDPVLMTIGNSQVHLGEFMYVYKKNNKDQSNDPQALNNYIDMFTVFKMKVKEAEDMKLDTSAAFRNELLGYRRQVAQQYLTDNKVNDSLLQEAYARMQEDVRASHILVRCDENALPKDTDLAWTHISLIDGLLTGKTTAKQISDYEMHLKASMNISKTSKPADTLKVYNIINPLRQLQRKYNGKAAPFDEVATMTSEDESARMNHGDLGYFTAFSMVYPFETAAYNTPVGKVSNPVRTRFGYHLVKVTDRRPAQGEILVAHIMIKAPDGMPAADSIAAKKKADEIYAKAIAGANFDTLARQFSDDKASAVNGGQLPWFGLYKMPQPFERAAFSLQNNGDISAPVKTAWGWHIIKRIDKRGIPPFDQVKADIKNKVSRDQRAMQGRAALIARVKAENNFTETPKAKDDFYKVVDSTYFNGKWTADRAKKLTKTMFTLAGVAYTQQEFAIWLENHEVRRPKTDVKKVVDDAYKQFVDEACVNYEDSQLEKKYPAFRYLMQEYRDGILLFDLMDKNVWSKAVKDTAGLRAFYDANKTNYMWPERSDATIYSCKDAKTAKKVRKMIKDGKDQKAILDAMNKDSQLNVTADHKVWNKNENAEVDANWKKGVSLDIQKDGRVLIIVTNEIIPPTPKTLQEARGMVTSDYQNQLEKDWVAKLKAKYPVTVDQQVLKQVK
ncbi:MAG TPA: peptidylprolyl isomerase [Bacteroidia bacterium]|nr:peptidylprolyl isomerase [Bacteroidia bacterium]